MRKWKQGILYYILLSKRFFKKLSFTLLLCAIPLLVFCFRNVSEQESGMLRIALVAEDAKDPVVAEIIENLMAEESVILYSRVESEARVKELVKKGEIDAGWIFKQDFLEKVEEFVVEPKEGRAPILIWEREDNVVLQLARLRLFGCIYSHFSYALYENYAWEGLGIPETVSEAELRELYESTDMEGNLFKLAYEDSDAVSEKNANYMTAPIRGLLAVFMILSGLAADMFFQQDLEAGVLDGVSVKKRQQRVYMYQLAAMLPTAVIVLVAMGLTGHFTTIGKELLLMGLYLAGCMFFCNIIRRICRCTKWLSVMMPLLMIALLLLSPIFLNLKKFRLLQYLLPSYYYLSGLQMPGWIVPMLVYAAVGAAVNLIMDKCENR